MYTSSQCHHNIDERVADILRSPLGCAFLAIIDESDFQPGDAAAPEVSLQVAAKGLRVAHKFEKRSRNAADCLRSDVLRNIAHLMLRAQESDWWFAPLNKQMQTWLQFPKNNSLSPCEFVPVATEVPASSASRQIGKPVGSGIYTSTLLQDSCSWQASLDNECIVERDKHFGVPPYAQWHLVSADSSKIYEINSPSDWHALSLAYPSKGLLKKKEGMYNIRKLYPLKYPTGVMTPEAKFGASSRQKLRTPDWASVARDFDAVHLTFGGLLTSQGVRIASDDGWSLLRFWDAEQTVWLNWRFESYQRVSDYTPRKTHLDLLLPSESMCLESDDDT